MPNASCSVERLVRAQGSLVRLAGTIDQTFDPLGFSLCDGAVAIVDLSGVNRVTSFGVREWSKAVQLIDAKYLAFINVRPAMVTQFNVVAGVSGNGQIISLYVPFVCTACGESFERLYDTRTQSDELKVIEQHTPRCPACGDVSEIDELPVVYFSFIKRQGPVKPPPEYDAVLVGKDAAVTVAPPLGERVQQEVEGEVSFIWLDGKLDRSLGLRRLTDSLEGTVVVVAQGVTEIDGAGVGQLELLLNYERGALWFARMPPLLWRALESRVGPLAHVGSLWISLECSKCHVTSPLELMAGTTGPIECPVCQTPDPLVAFAAMRSALKPLPAALSNSLHRRMGPRRTVGRGAFLSRYEVERLLGSGGMGEVYLARMQGAGGFQKQVALKRILPGLARTEGALEMFLSEARLAARLSHRNIVQIFDVGHERGEFYIAMEFVDGIDLRSLCQQCRAQRAQLPVAAVLRIAADVAAGLASAHEHVGTDGTRQPIVHRDVSPHNIIVASTGDAKITDFGIAKMETDADDTPASITKGKISYLAPEQVRHGRIDHRSDLFSLGVVLYEALTLNHPFDRQNSYQTLRAIVEEPIGSVLESRPDAPAIVDEIVRRATSKEIATRYQTAEALRLELERALAVLAPMSTSSWLEPFVRKPGGLHTPAGAHRSVATDELTSAMKVTNS